MRIGYVLSKNFFTLLLIFLLYIIPTVHPTYKSPAKFYEDEYLVHQLDIRRQSSTCLKQETICVPSGGACHFEGQQSTCNIDNVCTSCIGFAVCTEGVCPPQYIGSSCVLDSQCEGVLNPTPAYCNNSICVLNDTQFLVANDYCESDEQCCESLLCVNGRCQGYPVNATCTFDFQCDWNLYCGNGVCKPTLGQGKNCTVGSSQCQLNLTCQGSPAKCQPYFSEPANGTCVTCGCNGTLTCNSISATGKCIPYNAYGQACSTDTECPADSIGCFCDPDDGEFHCFANVAGINCNQCSDEFLAGIACLAQNKCKNSDLTTGSCGYQNCYNEIQEGRECLYQGISQCAFETSLSPAAPVHHHSHLLDILFRKN